MRVVCRRTGSGIIELDLIEVRPGVQCPGDEFWSVIDFDPLRQPAGSLDFFQLLADLFALDRFVHVDG